MNAKKVLLLIFTLVLIGVWVSACAAPTTPSPTVVQASAVPPTNTPVLPTPTPLPPTATATAINTPVPSTATATSEPHVAGADCAKCHIEEHQRWANTLHAASPADVLTNEAHNTEELLTDECIQCHAPFQAASYHVGDFVQPVDQTGPWKVVDKNVSTWQAIKCETCHDPTSKAPKKLAFFNPATQAYVAVKDTTELCEKCHQPGTDDSRNLKGSVHEGLQCATCHFQKGTEMSLDPKQACANCHPTVNPNHPDVTQLDTTYKSPDSPNDIHFISCLTCHPNGTPTPSAATEITPSATPTPKK